MNKVTLFVFALIVFSFTSLKKTSQYIDRQGEVTFFSYTSVENIQAENNQVLSILDTNTNEIAVRILMRAFVFKKTLMREHFNESYIESDLYPEATFIGKIIDFDPELQGEQIKIIKGEFTLKDKKKSIEIKVKINREGDGYSIIGDLELLIDDYDIKVPALLVPNIAKKIQVKFNFKCSKYEG